MAKMPYTCPTCEKVFETEAFGVMTPYITGRYIPSTPYCSVDCNPLMTMDAPEEKPFPMVPGLRAVMNKIEEEYGITEG